MGIVNGPAPEGRATGGDKGFWAGECNRLTVQLQEAERLRQEAVAACETLRQDVAELQAQLEAAAVTPAQQPDNAAERLDKVRRLIGSVVGWYECVEYLQEINQTEAWDQLGALLGHLQGEAWRCE